MRCTFIPRRANSFAEGFSWSAGPYRIEHCSRFTLPEIETLIFNPRLPLDLDRCFRVKVFPRILQLARWERN